MFKLKLSLLPTIYFFCRKHLWITTATYFYLEEVYTSFFSLKKMYTSFFLSKKCTLPLLFEWNIHFLFYLEDYSQRWPKGYLCRAGHYFFSWIVPLAFDQYLIILSVSKGESSTQRNIHFLYFPDVILFISFVILFISFDNCWA